MQNRQHVGELRTVRFYKDAKEALGISITGGREHGLPILISEIHEDGLAWRCKQFYVGDTILSINKYDLRNVKHAEAVRILTALVGFFVLFRGGALPVPERSLGTERGRKSYDVF